MKRFIAEWENPSCILLALPNKETDWNYILDDALRQFEEIINALSSKGLKCLVLCRDIQKDPESILLTAPENVKFIEMPFNDTWTRDYGFLTIESDSEPRTLDFGFNGWGLKFAADKDNLVNSGLCREKVIRQCFYRNNRDFELEGGSVDTDGRGTIITTTRCLTSPNRNGGKTKGEINEILQRRLGATHILWLDYGYLAGDDTDSHIDTLARLAPNDTILFVGCRNVDDEHFEELLKMRAQLSMFRTPEGAPYNLVELPLPDPIYDEDGQRLPATYANYLVTDKFIFMPVYDQKMNDMLACQTVRIAFPEHEVVPVDCRVLIKQHGSLHCSTMQLYEKTIVSEL